MNDPHPHSPHRSPTQAGQPPARTEASHSGRRRWLGAAAVGLTAAAAGFWWQGRGPGKGAPELAQPRGPASGQATSSPARLGEDFWALSLPQPSGESLALNTLRGRPLLINFWATWCPPCVREMPLLDQFYRQYEPKGLQMLGIAVDGLQPVKGFMERSPVGFAIGLAGADGSGLARTLGNTGGGLPFTVLADANGAIVRQQMGELQRSQLDEWAKALGLAP